MNTVYEELPGESSMNTILDFATINLQATKLFIVTWAAKEGWLPPPLGGGYHPL